MSESHWRTRLKRVWRWTRRSLLVTGPLSLLIFWMVFQHKPGWYQPVTMNDAEQRDARRDATRHADAFGDALVLREPFEVVLDSDEVTRWLCATPALWPRSAEGELREPAVHFDEDVVRLGVQVDRDGWRVVVSAGLALQLSPDGRDVTLRLIEARAGSLPIPGALIAWIQARSPVDPTPGDAGGAPDPESLLPDFQSVDDLRSGVSRANWFVWPNGERPFSIDTLAVESGRIRLGIRPR